MGISVDRLQLVGGWAPTRFGPISQVQAYHFIRLAEGPEGWGLVREIEVLPEIEDQELLVAAKKAEKRIKQRRKALKSK